MPHDARRVCGCALAGCCGYDCRCRAECSTPATGARAVAEHRSRSEWFNALSEDDQNMVAEVVRSASFAATFGFCCVLDGVRAFDSAGGFPASYLRGPRGFRVEVE